MDEQIFIQLLENNLTNSKSYVTQPIILEFKTDVFLIINQILKQYKKGKIIKNNTNEIILEKIKLLMALVSIVILIITSVCVNTSLSQVMISRQKEIALLRALGASKKNIVSFLGVEILVVSFLGALLGAFGGFALAQILGQILFGSSIGFRLISIVLAVFVSVFCALAASYYPIKNALSKNIANLLRGE